MSDQEYKYTVIDSPVGEILLAGEDGTVSMIRMLTGAPINEPVDDWHRDDAHFAEARSQLEAYFDGELREFTFTQSPRGTPFQQRVWSLLRQIPYGATTTYGELAHRIGNPQAARAVGSANNRNPLSIVVPCHRVIGKDGSLTGYLNGVDLKQRLLDHEQRNLTSLTAMTGRERVGLFC